MNIRKKVTCSTPGTDLLLKLHHFHEVLSPGGEGGAHLLHHGLDTMKVDASVQAGLELCSRTKPQSDDHLTDSHSRPAAEREQLSEDTRETS